MRSTGVASTSAPSISSSSSSLQHQRAGWRSARRAPPASTLRRRRSSSPPTVTTRASPPSSSSSSSSPSSFPDSNAAALSSSSSTSFAARATATKNKNPTLDEIVTAEALAVSNWSLFLLSSASKRSLSACGFVDSAAAAAATAALFLAFAVYHALLFPGFERCQCMQKPLGSALPRLNGTF